MTNRELTAVVKLPNIEDVRALGGTGQTWNGCNRDGRIKCKIIAGEHHGKRVSPYSMCEQGNERDRKKSAVATKESE